MTRPHLMAELWRGDILESTHYGHAVICDSSGKIVEAWGNPDQVIYPRSSCKMVQALPLMESGAAKQAGLNGEHLALACASHDAAEIHTSRVERWLDGLGLGESDLRCGAHAPWDQTAKHSMIRAGGTPCQYHNNCSGKHAGFLTYAQFTKTGSEYTEVDHPLQLAIRESFEELTGIASPGFGIDGCSAPNYATTVHGLARAMVYFANARDSGDLRQRAAHQLTQAMIAHPELVAGEGRACTDLMRAANGKAAVKTGADGVYTAILPEKGMGIALKISDGATRGSECAMAALLVRLGVVDPDNPLVQNRLRSQIVSLRGILAGEIRPNAALLA